MSSEEANEIVREAERLRRSRRALKVFLPTAAALGAGAAIAVGSIPGSDGVIHGCYAGSGGATVDDRFQVPGALRVVDPSLKGGANATQEEYECVNGENTISWNQSGPRGATGPQGVAGGQGATGGQGPVGTTGNQGAPGVPGAQGSAALLPAVQFGFDNSAGAMFLKLDGIKGESADDKHKGEIEISSFSFGTGATGNSSTGAGAGKTSFSSFTITKPLDKNSPLLQQGALSDKQYKEADVFFARKGPKGEQDYLELKIDDVLISSYKTTGGGTTPSETFVLNGIKGEATFINGHKLSNIALKLQPGVEG